jgi:hypothetical protein
MDTGSPRRRYSKPVLFAYEHPRDRLKSGRAVTAIEAMWELSCRLPSDVLLPFSSRVAAPSLHSPRRRPRAKRPGSRLFGTGSGGHHQCGAAAAL